MNSADEGERWTYTNGHSCTVEAEGEEDAFSQQTLVAGHELCFGEREGVSEVQHAVHVRVRKRREVLIIPQDSIFGVDSAFRVFVVGVYEPCGRVHLKHLLRLPRGLHFELNLSEVIAPHSGLLRVCHRSCGCGGGCRGGLCVCR